MEENILEKKEEQKQRILGITHNQKFHADEVFATAFLMIAFSKCEFVWKRVSQVPFNYNDDTPNVIIYDIGDGKYNHHQEPKERRPNGVPYAAFGLVFKQYGRKLLGDNFELFDKKFVQPLDLTDNYGQEKYPNPLSSYISSLNPLWDDDKESSDGQFEKAVLIAKEILLREFLTIQSKKNSESYIRDLVASNTINDEILIMPKFVHWQTVVVRETKIKFVIFPSPRGGWNVQTVPMNLSQDRTQRIPLPESWFNRTKTSDMIKAEHPGIIFWNRSFACFDTMQNACNLALSLISAYDADDTVTLESLVTPVEELV